MQNLKTDPLRLTRWRTLRKRLTRSRPSECAKALLAFTDEVNALIPLVTRASNQQWNMSDCQEIANALAVLMAGWLTINPANPQWPGRDRLYLCRKQDLVAACSVLSICGLYPPEYVARLIDSALSDQPAALPGIELAGQPSALQAKHAWESALESGRSKRRWRETCSHTTPDWTNPEWRESPAVWRSCLVLNHDDASLPGIRALAAQNGEKPAGLVAIVVTPRDDALSNAEQWREFGWETLVADRNESTELYSCLWSRVTARPLALMLTVSDEPQMRPTNVTARLDVQSPLLGDLPDDQFNALMGESLQF